MSDTTYTEDELKGMSRVLLRRAAREVLGIDNKEASNSKSADLIGRILEEQEGGGSNGESKKSSTKKTSSRSTKSRSSKSSKSSAKADPAPSGDVETLINAVGKGVDENHAEVKEMLQDILENQAENQRQQFILFGLITDIYKAVDEPDALEERLKELDEEWEAQGNDE